MSAMITVRRAPLFAAAAIATLSAVAACGSSSTKTSAQPTSSPTTSSSAPYSAPYGGSSPSAPATGATGAAALKVGLAGFPTALTDSTGKAVYLFELDTSPSSKCTGACATAWPPLTTTGKPTMTGGDASKLGTTMRSDGTQQVTYNGHPLYYFQGDAKAGDTKGQGLKAFGADWYLVATSGDKIDND
jgi:predicted lipoprotein with Yx(FWY)xxD motif